MTDIRRLKIKYSMFSVYRVKPAISQSFLYMPVRVRRCVSSSEGPGPPAQFSTGHPPNNECRRASTSCSSSNNVESGECHPRKEAISG